jgi:hypothetical protein
LTVSQKVALTLLITVVLFAGFTVLAFTGLFDLVEARFYNPSIVSSLSRELNADARAVDNFFTELENRFSLTLREDSVKRSFLPNQSAEDIFERSRIYGVLLESLGGFQGVRFIDNGGSRIHYSTYPADILKQDRLSAAYRNYGDTQFPYSEIASPDQAALKLIFDKDGNRVLFSFPFYDSFNVLRGTALFSLSIRAITDYLIGEGRIKAGENLSIVSKPVGIVLGMPPVAESVLIPGISAVWDEGILSLTNMDSVSGTSLALLSTKTSHGFFLGSLINENRFVFPQLMKIILLGAFFLTVYLTIFLFFNLRQDSLTIVQNRIKRLQISLIEQYYDRKSDIDWGRWSRELEQRREEIRSELKQGIKAGSKNKDEKDDIDVLIDKSWDELLTAIGGRRDKTALIDEEKLQAILNRVLSAGASIPAPAAVRAGTPGAAKNADGPPEAEAVEDLEELAETGALEELEELNEGELAEAAEAEDLEELAEAEAAVPGQAEPRGQADAGTGKAMAAWAEGELEELEEPEELEELEEFAALEEPDQPAGKAPSPKPPPISGSDLANLASRIEFSSCPAKEEEDTALDKEFEIVSPFATMLSDFSGERDTNAGTAEEAAENFSKNEPSGDRTEGETAAKVKKSESGIETLIVQQGASLIYKPFSYGSFSDPRDLENPEENPKKEPPGSARPGKEAGNTRKYDAKIIEEHEGIHYVSTEILNPGPQTEKKLNPDFKNLVNSVINGSG